MIKNLILLINDGEKFRMLSKSKAKKENKMCMFSRNAFKIEQHSQKFWKKIKLRYTANKNSWPVLHPNRLCSRFVGVPSGGTSNPKKDENIS